DRESIVNASMPRPFGEIGSAPLRTPSGGSPIVRASAASAGQGVLSLALGAPLADALWRGPTTRAGGATRLETSTAFALVTMSGLAYGAGFPPLSWSIAPWLALAPLLVACAALSPWRAALAGLWWAAIAALGVAWCLPTMLSHYFGLAAAPSWLAAVA